MNKASCCYCVQGDGSDDCDLVTTDSTFDGKFCMFESVTQPGTHIGVPPTGWIKSTQAEQRIDASLFRAYHDVSFIT